VALDADTGKLKWHYQFTPHDELDYDSTQVPTLADIEWQGRMRKVMLWANRNGVMYVLDRTTASFSRATVREGELARRRRKGGRTASSLTKKAR
jgi:alcohol dehydrogenase (cytochrome c)